MNARKSPPHGAETPANHRLSFPIVPRARFAVGAEEKSRLARIARRLLADEPGLDSTDHFGATISPGLGPWPGLFLEDHSGIVLADRMRADRFYGYRILLLAGTGDLVAIGVPRCLDFEAYCRDLLGLGQPKILVPAATHDRLFERCCHDDEFQELAAARARECGGLNLVPYMSMGGIWRLAAQVGARSGTPVRVAAPPPRLARRVNDKLWFAARATEVLGHRAVPPAHGVFGLGALVGRLSKLARSHAAVAIKLPDSASSVGNVVFPSAELLPLSLGALRQRLRERLLRTGWRGEYPLLVTAWESPVLGSPSVQLWIPGSSQGEAVIEGVFDQVVIGESAVFSGAVPTCLSDAWQERIVREAARLGTLIQMLGYFGRCSFDSILVGATESKAQLHWIQCNGRWGGTSLPMTLANRLVPQHGQPQFVIAERSDLQCPPRRFGKVLDALGDDLYVAGRRPAGIVMLSPSQIEEGAGYEIMAIGEDLSAARSLAQRFEQGYPCAAASL